MSRKDLYSNKNVIRAISPTRVTDNTAQVSEIIDMQGYESLLFAILAGTLADADATFTVLVEHGDNAALSDAAAVDDQDLLNTESDAGFTFADGDSVNLIGYIGDKRYVRLTITPVNNSGNADIAATAIQGHAQINPVNALA